MAARSRLMLGLSFPGSARGCSGKEGGIQVLNRDLGCGCVRNKGIREHEVAPAREIRLGMRLVGANIDRLGALA